jgi:hypothetical protein
VLLRYCNQDDCWKREEMRIEVELISPISAWFGERHLTMELPSALTVHELLLRIMQTHEHYEKVMREHGLYDGCHFHVLCMLEQKIVPHQHALDKDCSIILLNSLLGG